MSRYRKVDPRIWNDAKFRSLDDQGKLAFFFLLTHPHMTAIGAMRASIPGLSPQASPFRAVRLFRGPRSPLVAGRIRNHHRPGTNRAALTTSLALVARCRRGRASMVLPACLGGTWSVALRFPFAPFSSSATGRSRRWLVGETIAKLLTRRNSGAISFWRYIHNGIYVSLVPGTKKPARGRA